MYMHMKEQEEEEKETIRRIRLFANSESELERVGCWYLVTKTPAASSIAHILPWIQLYKTERRLLVLFERPELRTDCLKDKELWLLDYKQFFREKGW